MLELLMAEAYASPCMLHIGHSLPPAMWGVEAPLISLTVPLPQGQPVPPRAGAPDLLGTSVPAGEDGVQMGGEGAALGTFTRES